MVNKNHENNKGGARLGGAVMAVLRLWNQGVGLDSPDYPPRLRQVVLSGLPAREMKQNLPAELKVLWRAACGVAELATRATKLARSTTKLVRRLRS